MDKSINNPHDSFFRFSFTKPEDVRAFLLGVLPKEILVQLDLDELQLKEGSYFDIFSSTRLSSPMPSCTKCSRQTLYKPASFY
ncbi:Rpn family recombination-promoting nuclease/putative transposase [Chloroflexi bacterium TSY]|nr:Rpn family recombination-promoting nuclease/putative transposase [Chloroflexi bacterium TSY]